jgi:DNA-binding MarR family transcriptional regulator
MTQRLLHLAADLTLPLDAVSRTFGILAVRGAGKSNTAAVMAEEWNEQSDARDAFLAVLDGKGFQKILGKLATSNSQPITQHPTTNAAPRSPQTRRVAPALAQATSSRPARLVSESSNGLSGPEFKILASLAELEALGLHPADKLQLGLMAGYTNVRSGGFSEPLGRLVAAGLVVSPTVGQVAITESGRAHVGAVDPPATPEDMQARVMAKLTGPEQKLLRELIAHYPQPVTKEDLGTNCGYTNIRSGRFSEPLGRLSTLGLVESPARGVVAAAPSLFLEFRR